MSYDDPQQQMPPGQPPAGGQGMQQTQTGGQGMQQAQESTSLREMDVRSPTLCRLTISHPQQTIALGEDDHVLESYYNPQFNAWEVLVILQPRETEERETEDDEDEE